MGPFFPSSCYAFVGGFGYQRCSFIPGTQLFHLFIRAVVAWWVDGYTLFNVVGVLPFHPVTVGTDSPQVPFGCLAIWRVARFARSFTFVYVTFGLHCTQFESYRITRLRYHTVYARFAFTHFARLRWFWLLRLVHRTRTHASRASHVTGYAAHTRTRTFCTHATATRTRARTHIFTRVWLHWFTLVYVCALSVTRTFAGLRFTVLRGFTRCG